MQHFKALRLLAGDTAPVRQICELTPADLSPGDVLIEVAYSSINYKDALASKGAATHHPHSCRGSAASTCRDRVRESADPRWKAGDEVVVHGFGIGVDHDGGYAQMVRVPADWVVRIPQGFSLFEPMALGAAGYTAGLVAAPDGAQRAGARQGPGAGHRRHRRRGERGDRHAGAARLPGDGDERQGREAAYLQALGASEVIGRVEPSRSGPSRWRRRRGPARWTRSAATRWRG